MYDSGDSPPGIDISQPLSALLIALKNAGAMIDLGTEIPGNETALAALSGIGTFLKSLSDLGLAVDDRALAALVYDIDALNHGRPTNLISRKINKAGGANQSGLATYALQARAAAAVECLKRAGVPPLQRHSRIANIMNLNGLIATRQYRNSWTIDATKVRNWHEAVTASASDEPTRVMFEMVISEIKAAGIPWEDGALAIAGIVSAHDQLRADNVAGSDVPEESR